MRIAVLSPGPSLARFAARHGYDHVVAVNSAAKRHVCDTWADGDYQSIAVPGRRPHPGGADQISPMIDSSERPPALLTMSHSAQWLRENASGYLSDRIGRLTTFESLDRVGAPTSFRDYSTTAAIVYAVSLGATEIDVYGCDMDGDADYLGRRQSMRDHRRWTRERTVWNRLADWLDSRTPRVILRNFGQPLRVVTEHEGSSVRCPSPKSLPGVREPLTRTDRFDADLLRELRRRFPGRDALRLLHLGCGPGRLVRGALEQGHSAIGIDPLTVWRDHGLGEWSILGPYLFTADLSRWLTILDTAQRRAEFDVIVAPEHLTGSSLVTTCFGRSIDTGMLVIDRGSRGYEIGAITPNCPSFRTACSGNA